MVHRAWRSWSLVVAYLAAAPAVFGSPARAGDGFRAGAAVVDITPEEGVSLDGPISKPGPARGVHDRLHARALVLDDSRIRLAIVVTDLTMIERAVCEQIRQRVHEVTGLAPDHLLISAVHTHAAPRVRHGRRGPLDDRYYELLVERIATAVQKAVANLAPACIGWGSFDKPEYVRCRRWLCEPDTVGANPFGETGERVRSVAGKGGRVIKPAGPVDPQVSVLSIQHADGRPLAVLANYSVHYCGGYRGGMVSADYFGYFAGRLAETLDAGPQHPPFVGIMTNGTSGNTGAIQSGGKRYGPFELMQVAGRVLADDALDVIGRIEHRGDVALSIEAADLELGVRRPDAERIAWARRVLADPKAPRPHPWTQIYAQQTLLLAEYPATRPVKLQAIGIRSGGATLGIGAIACEVFAETGLAIKRTSPCDATFTISLANGAEGYLPPPEQHAWGGYETWPATSSCLEIEAEPKIRQALLAMLRRACPP